MKIIILGVGAIGSNLALNLAHDTNEELTVLDRDRVEPRNYQAGTQFYTREQVGKPKVDALALNIFLATGKRIQTINQDLEKNPYLIGEYSLAIDCFDNYEARKKVWAVAADGVPCVHVGFSPKFTFEICWNENYETPNDVEGFDICEAQGAASFVRMVAGVASLNIQDYIKTKTKRNLVGNYKSVTELV